MFLTYLTVTVTSFLGGFGIGRLSGYQTHSRRDALLVAKRLHNLSRALRDLRGTLEPTPLTQEEGEAEEATQLWPPNVPAPITPWSL